MKYLDRELGAVLQRAARQFPAVVLTGPRRAGKTELLRHLFPEAQYVQLEDPDVLSRVQADPQGFLDGLRKPVVLDEIQNAPELFAFVRSRIDARPRKTGQWFLTGSQEAGLMHDVSESMAGRAAILQLLPLSARETPKVTVLHGGYPEALARPRAAALWFSSYVQTYLERDVRAITAVRDLATFRRFVALTASRHGQMVNKSDLAAPLGVSVPTIGQWLGILEATGLVLLIPPYFENLGKRLVKSPKLYFSDSGLVCHLLGIETEAELQRSPFLGAIFEGFVAAELVKAQIHRGQRREVYYFRDQQGLEVDFVVPAKQHALELIEAKATHTPTPAMAQSLVRLSHAITAQDPERTVRMTVVHRPTRGDTSPKSLGKGARAMPLPAWLEAL
jgi:predicted AAA+ superfamily ATPase